MSKNLVVFFSASGTTKQVAQKLNQAVESDIYEIKPQVPYTPADLNWMDKSSRTTIEMSDKSSRPEIVSDNVKIQEYDRIFLGFPIWWYVAPTIVNTFLEANDFSNKKIVLFATSGGSGFGETVKYLKNSVDTSCEIIQGKLFSRNVTVEELKEWVSNF